MRLTDLMAVAGLLFKRVNYQFLEKRKITGRRRAGGAQSSESSDRSWMALITSIFKSN
jgi:hypothetical protein